MHRCIGCGFTIEDEAKASLSTFVDVSTRNWWHSGCWKEHLYAQRENRIDSSQTTLGEHLSEVDGYVGKDVVH